MNCNTGIWRTSVRQLNEVADGGRTAVESFAYGTADGMLSSEGVGANLAGWKMRDGSLWFPTTKGIVVIDPRRRDTEPPRVLIEGVDHRPRADRDRWTGSTDARPGKPRDSIHRPELEPAAGDQVQIPAHWTRSRLGGRRRAPDGLLFAPSAGFLHLQRDRRQRRRRVERGRTDPRDRGPAALLSDLVVPGRGRVEPGRVGVGVLAISRRPVEARIRPRKQAFSRQLIESQERERQRIAAELHDSLGQNLLVVKNRALLGALSQHGRGGAQAVRRDRGDGGADAGGSARHLATICGRTISISSDSRPRFAR